MRLSQRLIVGALAEAAYAIIAASDRRWRDSARFGVRAVQATGAAVAARACEVVIGDATAARIIEQHERHQADPRVN